MNQLAQNIKQLPCIKYLSKKIEKRYAYLLSASNCIEKSRQVEFDLFVAPMF